MKRFCFVCVSLLLLLFSSCGVQKASSGVESVPFEIAGRYFKKNVSELLKSPLIRDGETFEKHFGAAAVMGKGGLPTEIDFSKEFVIAVVLPETDVATTLTPVDLKKNAKGELVLEYGVGRGKKQSYTTVPCLLLVVENKWLSKVMLRETEL